MLNIDNLTTVSDYEFRQEMVRLNQKHRQGEYVHPRDLETIRVVESISARNASAYDPDSPNYSLRASIG